MNRYCPYCGSKVDENANFCGSCGQKLESYDGKIICKNCGKEIERGSSFCPYCGTAVVNNVIDVAEKNSGINDNGKRNAIIAAVCSAGAIILIAAVIFAVINITAKKDSNNSDYAVEATQTVQPTPTATPTAAPTAAPTPTPPPTALPLPTNKPEQYDRDYSYKNGYSLSVDRRYRFVCPYPDNFIEFSSNNDFFIKAYSSPDSSGYMYVCATANKTGLTPGMVRDNFYDTYGGTIDYKDSGNDWCVIRTVDDYNECHYGYFKLTDGMIRGFEMHFDGRYFGLYDKYINDIYKDIVLY